MFVSGERTEKQPISKSTSLLLNLDFSQGREAKQFCMLDLQKIANVMHGMGRAIMVGTLHTHKEHHDMCFILVLDIERGLELLLVATLSVKVFYLKIGGSFVC